ncbi:ABC transporter ATP-binding protein YojI [Rubripirellula lacrimiformis]|uniref:ABC transporter ATP-binding protein YojI n=1 Tax=Rubripirellula lacrimiformis TaxID=1930273 RepID=A0A517NJK1_9BACT|nr:cyclic peptide export ABC transporter [Rubripirellula lacrimiformis]QDT07305.1 ABC transporter ATP-binding protein YojI [Rubripirellula lacrimiformis]
MKLFLILIRSSWVSGLVSGLLGALSGMANLGLIMLIHRALTDDPSDSQWLPYLFAGACVLVLITQVTAKHLLVQLSQATAARLRYELCTKIIAAPLPTLESVGSHRLLAALIDDVNSITSALSAFPAACANAMVLVCGLVYLATLSVPLAGGTILMASIGVFSFMTGLRFANRHLRQAREDQDEVVKQLRAMIDGIKELKGNNMRCLDFVYDVLLPADTKMRHSLIIGSNIQGFAHSWGRLFLFIGIGLLLFAWPQIATVSTATLTGYVLTILYLTYPLDGILGWLPAMNSASIAVAKIETLGLMIDQPEHQTSLSAPARFRSLEMHGVTYQYDSKDDNCFALGPVDLTLSPGETLFIAGGNGSGKTTLAKLLTGLYVPDAGRVQWNGNDVTDKERADYRQLFSTVFVEGHLFDRLLGIDATPGKLQHWLSILGMEDKVNVQTGRLLTGELSRGQHKRLALLVAALDDRPIFVFDEWAAEQDPGFKDIFYQQILPELHRSGKTVVAITHDDRYFSVASRVLKVADGRLNLVADLQSTPRRAA